MSIMYIVLTALIKLICFSQQTEADEITVFRKDLDSNAARLFLNDHRKLSSSWELSLYMTLKIQVKENNEQIPKFVKMSNLRGQQFDDIAYNTSRSMEIRQYLRRRLVEGAVKASAVDSYSKERAFIASAIPNGVQQVQVFWDMVWKNHVLVIAMLTGPHYEAVESIHYWPLVLGETWTGEGQYQLTVENLGKYDEDTFICTHMSITCSNCDPIARRIIALCQYTDWKDMGVARDVKALLNFRKMFKALNSRLCYKDVTLTAYSSDSRANHQVPIANQPLRPIVIQSMQGEGRPGTMIAIDVLIDRMDNEDGLVDLAGTIQRLRSQRLRGVKNREQYSFCIESLAAYKGILK